MSTSCVNLQLCVSFQVSRSLQRLPQVWDLIMNVTARLEPYQFLHYQGLYSDLALRKLQQQLSNLAEDVESLHDEFGSGETQKLSKDVRQ